MARFIKNRSKASGLAPGSLVFIGKQKMEQTVLQLIQYSPEKLEEKELSSLTEISSEAISSGVTWLNIYGIHDLNLINELGAKFSISPFLLEDILNTDQRPKYERFENIEIIILKMLKYNEATHQIFAEQITLVVGNNFVITLQEQRGDVFDPVRDRIRFTKGRVRLNDSDYLAYALMDTIADNYAIVVETIGREIEALDTKIFHSEESGLAEQIYSLKTELNYLRKSIRPVTEVIFNLLKNEDTHFQEKNKVFLRDLNELITHTAEAIELYNSLISDQLNIYNTNTSNAMNQVMKVLTIFASIFIPLTFLAGIYGMNFEYIPELSFKYAYPIFWIIVLITGTGLLVYFRRKKWL